MGYKLKRATIWREKPQWQPWANTFGYYTFDDQNDSQITDFSGNNRNLTWWTMPTYTLVSWTNYAGDYTNVSSWLAPNYSSIWAMDWNYTILIWVKPTQNSQSYINTFHYSLSSNDRHQISIIWGYNSWQFEYYDDSDSWGLKRTVIKSWASLNTWYLIGYTRSWSSVATYCDGVAWNTITWNTTAKTKNFYLWSSNSGDRLKWQIWECVIENRVRTAEEIADYYNQTKWNYGYTPWETMEELQLRPTITPIFEYSYDFKWKTAGQITSDWWTIGSKNNQGYVLNANWLWNLASALADAWATYPMPIDLTEGNKITFTLGSYTTSTASFAWMVRCWLCDWTILGWTWSAWQTRIHNSAGSGTNSDVQVYNSSCGAIISWTTSYGSWTGFLTCVIDFPNNTITYNKTSPVSYSTTHTMTETEKNAILSYKSYFYVCATTYDTWVTNYIQTMSITIE